jgi:hypothetical protein
VVVEGGGVLFVLAGSGGVFCLELLFGSATWGLEEWAAAMQLQKLRDVTSGYT